MRFVISLIVTLLISLPSYAQWYEAQGHAFVTNGNNKVARTKAIENALKKALLVAGASVSSVRQVVNGLLTQDEINIRASGNINSFELVNETYSNNTITVTIKADIFPQNRQCFSADYQKSLLITKSHIKHREQANIGGIYNLDKSLVSKLSNKIRRDGMYLETDVIMKSSSEFSLYHNSLQREKIKNIVMSLTSMMDSQYVMFSEIEDVSFANDANNNWQFWQEDEFDRHFNLSVYVYNGTNGELIFEKQYQSSAPWTFTKRAQVDVSSDSFWQSQYGVSVEQTLNSVISDIDDHLMCQPTRGKIVQLSGDSLMINLGKKHGVKVGDEFSLLHVKNFTSDNGKTYAGYNVSPFKVKVTHATHESATAVTTDAQILDSIQVNDLAVRY